MAGLSVNKRKIINDPVYGFININSELIFDIIEHPYFQRLRRIKQLGLTELVYPGARHTRFQHTLGAMHLMYSAIEIIRSKGQKISKNEEEAALLSILLHDIGHAPFSHTLEYTFIEDATHEEISLLFMEEFNRIFDGKLSMGIQIFGNKYKNKFLHQLVSSQLDMDRMDYLKRDSFFTGVSEGVISSDRIIKMLKVVDGHLAIEAKGIYSVEKFLIARRLMYWQVYLHKTVVAAEYMLIKILQRAKELITKGEALELTSTLAYFLTKSIKFRDISENQSLRTEFLNNYAQLDDNDIIAAIKTWTSHPDFLLSSLCQNLINRKLYKIEFHDEPINKEYIAGLELKTKRMLKLSDEELKYFVFSDEVSNNAYSVKKKDHKINIVYKNGEVEDISKASDMLNISVLSKNIRKFFVCYPKEIID